MKQLYESLGISKEVYEYGEGILEALKERFAAIDETAEYNQLKVIAAMQKAHVSAIASACVPHVICGRTSAASV